ncbi:uncharacterized protein LOC117644607 isoform X1 [Thrips palmi]|nr:uncharacterized protein LOC117644607 isoform X1 [Thrips palmi]XP_034240102.1 uncharacterized protein LOC117644607 isoform X1 [Thrips palmi]XP_034240103.1 uncharacterized protein LOC117644607 isoform X1 [Thrips palmi]
MESDFKAQLTDKVLPGLLADGALGKDVTLVSQEIAPVGGYGVDHWMSSTFKVAVEVRDAETNTTRTTRMVAKFQVDDPVWADCATTSRNEDVMYNQVLPFFEELWQGQDGQPLNLFPKCYLAEQSPSPLVVMEDLTAQGFKLSPSLSSLDGAHVFLALQHLGKLHALSYCAKVRRKSDFLSLARELREAEYIDKNRAYHSGYLSRSLARGLKRLAARGGSAIDAATVEHLRRRFRSERDASNAFDLMADARTPEEPLAVVTHGDFCRNNIMFKYDPVTGKPVDVRFFDLQKAKYCSPAVDLSFFLFINTTPSQRAAHWDDFFVAYYDGLTTAMRRLLSSGPGMSPTMEMPSLASLRADFARHALYGYVICAFFLPVVQAPPGDAPAAEDCAFVADIADKFEAGAVTGDMFTKIGGEAADDTVADLLIEFVERGLVGL